MNTIDWQFLCLLAINTLGLVEWIKGFFNKINGNINGNILRILQVAVAMLLAFVAQYLPVFVINALTVVSITTLYKTDILSFGANIFKKAGTMESNK